MMAGGKNNMIGAFVIFAFIVLLVVAAIGFYQNFMGVKSDVGPAPAGNSTPSVTDGNST